MAEVPIVAEVKDSTGEVQDSTGEAHSTETTKEAHTTTETNDKAKMTEGAHSGPHSAAKKDPEPEPLPVFTGDPVNMNLYDYTNNARDWNLLVDE
jgi:hypothetical protein